MSLGDALKSILMPLVSDAVATAESRLPTLMPGLAGALLEEALAIPAIQAMVNNLEGKAVDEALTLLGNGLDALRKLVLAHVHGQLGAWLKKELSKPISFTLSAAQGAGIAKAIEQGKLDDILRAAGVMA